MDLTYTECVMPSAAYHLDLERIFATICLFIIVIRKSKHDVKLMENHNQLAIHKVLACVII